MLLILLIKNLKPLRIFRRKIFNLNQIIKYILLKYYLYWIYKKLILFNKNKLVKKILLKLAIYIISK